MQEIKSVSAHRISKETGHVGRVWQEESFDRALRREEDLGAKIQYMVNNPVRAARSAAHTSCRRLFRLHLQIALGRRPSEANELRDRCERAQGPAA